MLELLLKCTDEKNISLAVRGYKIFFSSTALTLNCKPMAGLNKNRKPVAGLTTKNCQLISGRGKFSGRGSSQTARTFLTANKNTKE